MFVEICIRQNDLVFDAIDIHKELDEKKWLIFPSERAEIYYGLG